VKNSLRLIFLLSLILEALCSSAQLIEDEDTTTNQPFFKATRFNSRCFVAVDGIVGQIVKKDVTMITGFSLNWVVNHKYVTRAYFDLLGLPLNVQPTVYPDHQGTTLNLTYQYAGLGFGYIFYSNKLFSIQPELDGGWAMGKYAISGQNYRSDFAMFIPTVYGTCNVSKYFRVGIGLNYRISAGSTLAGLKDADMSGIGGLVFVRFGTF
jgi:hypothetical protein